jgi:uroporphyrinogen-III decarboxylase
LGDDGAAHFRIPPTPLKILHWLAGPEQAIYFVCDNPDEVMELVRLYEVKRLELVKKAVGITGTLVFTSGDNMDSMMYGPPFFEDFCGHSFGQISEVIHEHGKLLFTHACGQLAGVIKLCADSGVDGMEGMAPPPLGDLGFGEARRLLGPEFVLQGGMTYTEEEMKGPDARERIFAAVRDLFETLPDKRRFVFSSGCCLSPKASYENVLALRDACWAYGRI